MDILNPRTPYDFPEAKEGLEGIYMHKCYRCSHVFFGYKERRGLSCNKCRTEFLSKKT